MPPAFPDELLAELGRGSLSMQIRQGKPEAVQQGLALLSDAKSEQSQRLAAIQAFGTAAHAEAMPLLLKLATRPGNTDKPFQQAAMSSLQIYNDPAIGSTLAAEYATLPSDVRALALNILASRQAWSIDLLKSPAIAKQAIDPDLVARMRLHGGDELTELLDQHFPQAASPVPALSAEAIRKILAANPGDLYRGEPIYAARCASCHTLFFKGGKVGPDLTRYQRDDLSTMLNSILAPNAEIREGYENFTATTKDGRILSGFLAEDDANTIVIRGFDGSNTTLSRNNINELTPAGRSLMPEGLLNGLDDQQLRDLFAYLKISQPISK